MIILCTTMPVTCPAPVLALGSDSDESGQLGFTVVLCDVSPRAV